MATFDPRTAIMDSNNLSADDYDHHEDFGSAFDDSSFSDRLLHIYIQPIDHQSTKSPSAVRVKTLQISSPILAARSPFFYKLFSNGTRGLEQRDVTLRINASEEAGFMELLNFMYNNKLTVITAPAVLDVLIVAEKYNVASCVRYCGRLLRNLPMTSETVLLYLDLPSNILTDETFRPLTITAKQFYAVHYKDITKFQDEILGLPLASVDAILSSEDLQVATEDAVYMFVLKWARMWYPKIEDRCEIITNRLGKFIRYPYMTYGKLTEVLTCKEFDPIFARKVVLEALSFKIELQQKQHTYISNENPNLNHRFAERAYKYHTYISNIENLKYNDRLVERAYKYLPTKMVIFEKPHPHLEMYFDLKRDACVSLFPLGSLRSEAFNLGCQGFYLCVQCSKMTNMLEERSFRIVLGMEEEVTVSFKVDYEFAVRTKPGQKFVTKCKGNYTFAIKQTSFEISLFEIPWRLFIGKDSVYFVDDVIYLSIKLAVRDLKKLTRN